MESPVKKNSKTIWKTKTLIQIFAIVYGYNGYSRLISSPVKVNKEEF